MARNWICSLLSPFTSRLPSVSCWGTVPRSDGAHNPLRELTVISPAGVRSDFHAPIPPGPVEREAAEVENRPDHSCTRLLDSVVKSPLPTETIGARKGKMSC